MPTLELEIDETHTYRLRGAEIPGVTQVLTAVGATPSFWFLTEDELNFYRSRGHAVHRMIELDIKGSLDRRTIAKEIKPYLIGWHRFMNDYNVEVITLDTIRPDLASGIGVPSVFKTGPFVETPLHHETFRYGVTPDVVAKVKGQLTVIELKATSGHSAATSLQTSAQALAVEQVLGVKMDGPRWACRLLPEEPFFDPKQYVERGDRSTWLGALNLYNWKQKNNIRSNR